MTPSDTAVRLAGTQPPQELWLALRTAARYRRRSAPQDRPSWSLAIRDYLTALELQAHEPAYIAQALVFGSAKGAH